MGHSLEAVHLSKRYGSLMAVDNLNFRIDGAKCVGFLGPNGAGKTTTLKIFTSMINPSTGSTLIDGVSVQEDKKAALRSCGSLVETPEMYHSFTPMEALSMIAEIRGIPKGERVRLIRDAVFEVKMDQWMDRKIGKFSKGMKQRINIASALLSDPEIVILDEPTSGLDPRGTAEVKSLIKTLKTEGRLIFMSSHLLSEVSEVCDEVAIIDHGKLLVHDTIRNVTRRFAGKASSYLVEVEFSKPVTDTKAISRLGGVHSVNRIDQWTVQISFSGGMEVQEGLLSKLASTRMGMISFKPVSSELEDSYLNLVKDTL
ncbi:MAG: ABC transporter ATP-binding protein [Candidatus Micrarchaeota archaeon]|nr:ABC transporter ATP-binding protein [Candidatus Micrarchaeota archaeon]